MERMDKGAAGDTSRTRRKAAPAVGKRKLNPPQPKTADDKYKAQGNGAANLGGKADNLLYLNQIAQDPTAPAAARVAAIKTLEAMRGGAGSAGLSTMTRAEIAAEINWCCSQLGRKPLITQG